jgi:Tfp pilus assembly protein PilO
MALKLRDKTGRYARLQWWLLGVLVAFAAGFWAIVYRPADARANLLHVEVERQRQELEVSRERARDLPRIAAENKALNERLVRAKRLPRQSEWAEFVRDITTLSQQRDLRKFNYKYGVARREGSFSQLPIQLEFEGDMRNVDAFLREVERLPRLTRLRNVHVKGIPERNGFVTVQLTLNTYFTTD